MNTDDAAWTAGFTERVELAAHTGERYTLLRGKRCPRCAGALAVDGGLTYCLGCAYEPPESAARPTRWPKEAEG